MSFDSDPANTHHAGAANARPSWDLYFMRLADEVSTRATCPRRRVGAIVVKGHRILTTGYNGAPPEMDHCTTSGCYLEDGHCVRTIHAEQNAILQAAMHGVPIDGTTLYTTAFPCHVCARMIAGAGIRVVIFRDGLDNWSSWGKQVLQESKVSVAILNMSTGRKRWILRFRSRRRRITRRTAVNHRAE